MISSVVFLRFVIELAAQNKSSTIFPLPLVHASGNKLRLIILQVLETCICLLSSNWGNKMYNDNPHHHFLCVEVNLQTLHVETRPA